LLFLKTHGGAVLLVVVAILALLYIASRWLLRNPPQHN
jgi:hypothetical protein